MELPSHPVIAALVERYADFFVRHGKELGTRPLVSPTGEFFPDRFDADEPSATALVRRMQLHAGMDDIPVGVRVVETDFEQKGGGCGSGACAAPADDAEKIPRVLDDGQQWILQIPAPELRAPVVLTTMVARVLGHVFLVETAASPNDIAQPIDVTVDVAAVALGFGALMLEGSYIYSNSCGGPHIGKATRLTLPELAVLVSLFVELGGHATRPILRELGITQRSVLDDAVEWAKSNPRLLDRLRSDPARVARGDFAVEEARPWLARLLGRKSKTRATKAPDDISFDDLSALEATLLTSSRPGPSKAKKPEDDALRALVDEALRETGADAE